MNQVQSTILVTLKSLMGALEAEKVNYFSIGGTSIGAVRHQGFIPWDDDVDIGMRRKDFDQFCDLVRKKQGLLADLEVILPEDPVNPFIFAKVICPGTEDQYIDETNGLRGLFIDIFPFDEIVSVKFSEQLTFLHFKLLNKAVLRKQVGTRAKIGPAWIPFLPLLGWYLTYNLADLKRKRERVVRKFGRSGSDIYFNYSTPYRLRNDYIFESEIAHSTPYKFEDTTVPMPDGFDGILKRVYGDYMKLPPDAERSGSHIGKS